MRLTGKVKSIQRDWFEEKWQITFEVNEEPSDEWNELNVIQKLSIEVKKFRNRRSLNANALLWKCIGQLADALKTDKWVIYLRMLKSYGKFTYICVKPSAVEDMKKQWRAIEVVGPIKINNSNAVQLLCYFGSSTYDTNEFSILLEGVFAEMYEQGLQLPDRKQTEKALEKWEKQRSKEYEKTMVGFY